MANRSGAVALVSVFSLSLMLSAAACGVDLGECPSDSQAQQIEGREVVQAQCVRCHSSQLSGVDRQSAPVNLNFDNLSTVREEAESMYGEAEEGEMPPEAPLDSASLEAMRVWLACGAPDVSAGQ